MADFEHLFPMNTASTEQYKYPREVRGSEFKVPPRDDRVGHGQQLAQDVSAAALAVRERAEEVPEEKRPKGVVLDYYEEFTMKEIGATLNFSESRVSQMHSSIVQRLQNQLAPRRPEFGT